MSSRLGLVCVALSVTPGSAFAESTPSAAPPTRPTLLILSVADGPPLPTETASLNATAEELVDRSNRFELLPLTDALDPAGAAVRSKAREDGERELSVAQGALDSLDTQRSEAAAGRAITAFEHSNLSRNFARLIRSWVIKVASEVANGEARAVERDLTTLIRLDPRVTLPPNYFTPEDLSRAAQLKRETLKSSEGRIEVRTIPVAGRVYADGQFRGVAPMTVTGLTPIEHALTTVYPGYSASSQMARRGAVTLELHATEGLGGYEAALKQLAAAPDLAAKARVGARYARGLSADQLLLLALRRDVNPSKLKLSLARVDTRSGKSLAFEELTLDTNEPSGVQALRPLQALLATDNPHPVLPAEASSTSRGQGRPLSMVGRVLLGTGAALVASGVTLGILALREQHAYQEVHTVGASGAHGSQLRGRREALASDGLNVGGLLCLGVGGYFTFFGPSSPAPTPSRENP